MLWKREKPCVNFKTPNGQRALILTVAEGTNQDVFDLLEGNAAAAAVANAEYMGETALSVAVKNKFWPKVRDLITFGADGNVRVNGQTVLLLVLDQYQWIRKKRVCDCGKIFCDCDNARFDVDVRLHILEVIARRLLPCIENAVGWCGSRISIVVEAKI